MENEPLERPHRLTLWLLSNSSNQMQLWGNLIFWDYFSMLTHHGQKIPSKFWTYFFTCRNCPLHAPLDQKASKRETYRFKRFLLKFLKWDWLDFSPNCRIRIRSDYCANFRICVHSDMPKHVRYLDSDLRNFRSQVIVLIFLCADSTQGVFW